MNGNDPQFQWHCWHSRQDANNRPQAHCLADIGHDAQAILYAGPQGGITGYYWAGALYPGYATKPERAERRMGYPTMAAAQQAAENWAKTG